MRDITHRCFSCVSLSLYSLKKQVGRFFYLTKYVFMILDTRKLWEGLWDSSGTHIFKTTDVWFWMAELIATTSEIEGRVIDNGCWNGFLGIVASYKESVHHICFHDICKSSLEAAERNFSLQGRSTTSEYVIWDELYNAKQTYDSCISNLPQNPALPFCWAGWSELQISVTLRIWEILSPGWAILTKSVSYAERFDNDSGINSKFRVDKVGLRNCVNPNDLSPAQVQYFLLRKK